MSEIIYRFFLRLYPSKYRNRYGAEMLQNFRDLQRDKTKNLWLIIIKDLAISIPMQNWEALQEAYEPESNLRINSSFVIASVILLIPFMFFFAMLAFYRTPTGFLGTLLRNFYASRSEQLFAFAIAPLVAVALLSAALIYKIRKTNSRKNVSYYYANAFSFVIIILSIFGVGLIFFHDSVHCFLNFETLTHFKILRACLLNN